MDTGRCTITVGLTSSSSILMALVKVRLGISPTLKISPPLENLQQTNIRPFRCFTTVSLWEGNGAQLHLLTIIHMTLLYLRVSPPHWMSFGSSIQFHTAY